MLRLDSQPLTRFKAGQPISKRVTYETPEWTNFKIFRDRHIDDHADRGSSMSTVNPTPKFTVYGTLPRISSTVGLTCTI